MKKLFLSIVLGGAALLVTGCKQPAKTVSSKPQTLVSTDNIVKNVYVDDEFGDDEMEVVINNTHNTVIIHFEGETYQLSKNNDLPSYTAENPEYRFSDIKGEITFLKKDSEMVLFHHEPNNKKSSEKASN
ncbi:hypothetical protein [Chryseobacterium sp. PMSZPI]|uniref:hypothetical protein n=1 Tax=Chryseobacterium sp. PMSZPI TaxID=1033900 RepID=UPI000C3474CF|nr:hypothetical protein [Chryseobacterium sp. PMSZPI]PKF75599.1 hypothetical protein CW752_02970 [Chryseobacterium sp. PMSZPI]